MLTHHRLKRHIHIFPFTGIVSVNPHPRHITTAKYFIFSHHRNIIFYLARNDTSGTSCASTQINRHAPMMFVVRMVVFPQRYNLMSMMRARRWIFFVCVKSCFLNKRSHFHRRRCGIFRIFQRVICLG